jgi:hypothetical protein
MFQLPGRFCALLGALALTLGCGQPVREDRTVHFAPQGNAVGFQHGADGVFVADKDGGGLTKVFSPDANTLAVSTPLFSPDGRRLLFTTAHGQGNPPGPRLPGGLGGDPAGNVHHQQEVTYTCWLRGDGEAEPKALFQARCDHVGYVAANLAVRWHPRGDRVLFIEQTGPQQHGVFELDLATQKKRRVFPHLAAAILFDWAPDREHLACVLSSPNNDQSTDGIWVGRPDQETWWHVPESEKLAQAALPSLIERLRATRPVWTRDGARFAFVTSAPSAAADAPPTYHVRTGDPATRVVALLTQGPQRFRDLHWSPDGRLGLVREGRPPTLHEVGPKGELAPVPARGSVRRFAGWDASGKHLAYVTPELGRPADGKATSLLFLPDPEARESVVLADGAGRAGREAFSGMRVTFPQWSPAETKLSVWFTFAPPHRCWLLQLLGLGLRPGDPAAVLRPASGEVSWMAVNALEKAQVGHYYLLKRRYEEAWKWYAEAGKGLPKPRPAAGVLERWQGWLSPQNITFFEYHCLLKLGRKDEAAAKLLEFRQRLQEKPAAPAGGSGQPTASVLPQAWEAALEPDSPLGLILRDLYAAEVFVGVDALADGQAFFRDALANAATDPEKLSSAVALAQLHALAGQPEQLAAAATDSLMPAALRVWQPKAGRPAADLNEPQTFLLLAVGATLLPLYTPDYLAAIPDRRLRELVTRWEALRGQARDDVARLAVDLFLDAAYKRLGREDDRRGVTDRLKNNTARAELFGDKTPSEVAGATEEAVRGLLQWQGLGPTSN